MRLTLLVEGETESIAIHSFLQRWLNRPDRLSRPVGIRSIDLGGSGSYLKEFAARAKKELEGGRCFAVIGLLDYYGSGLSSKFTVAKAKAFLEDQVGDRRFRQHFAVHETEAWLLSDPSVLPAKIQNRLPDREPETVNLVEPPSKLLSRLYQRELNKKYRKTVDGARLFQHLDPEQAYQRCPHLAALLDDMLDLARAAGF